MSAPIQAAAIEFGEERRVAEDGGAEGEGAVELGGGEMADGRVGDVAGPGVADGVVEQDAHETMIEADGPAMGGGEAGEGHAGEVEPTFDPAPLILTLGLEAGDQARFDRLREAHFPPERNFIAAHVTLFHHLPAGSLASIVATLEEIARATAPFAAEVTGVRSLGRGVAYTLGSPALSGLRSTLASTWSGVLTAQDRQGFRPHVTVQNKVEPAQARALLQALSAGFVPFAVRATGLLLWRYRGGPWEAAGAFGFRGRREDPPGPRHR